MTLLRRLLGLGLLGLAACGGDGGGVGPVAGEITFGFTGGAAQTGALLIRVIGAVEEVTPIAGYRIASAPIAGATATRVVITGSIASGDVLRLRIPDLDRLDTYSVTLEQAASATDFSLVDPAQYSVYLRR